MTDHSKIGKETSKGLKKTKKKTTDNTIQLLTDQRVLANWAKK